MSLGIAFKGPEGIVLAADSRVTLMAQIPGENMLVPATYDNATKLLKIAEQKYVGAVTYGLGAIGQAQPRTAHSYIPELEENLKKEGVGRLQVKDFAQRLSAFFMDRWTAQMPSLEISGRLTRRRRVCGLRRSDLPLHIWRVIRSAFTNTMT